MTAADALLRLSVLLAAAAGAACAGLPAGAPAASGATVPAPAIAAGERWTYRVRDGYTGFALPTERWLVTAADGGRIRVAVSRERAGREETHLYDAQWGWLHRPATNLQTFDYRPAYRALDFPLAVGKRWRARGTATDPADGRRFPVWIEGRVEGWERIQVPAGEFDALRIRRDVFLDYWEHSVRDRSEIIELEWYVPAVKQAVRREARSEYLSYLYSSDRGGPTWVHDAWLIWELEGYTVR